MREATTEELLERIKELEENEQVLNDAHCKLMDKCDKLNKELEDAENRIKELEANQPKWITVKSRKPKKSIK